MKVQTVIAHAATLQITPAIHVIPVMTKVRWEMNMLRRTYLISPTVVLNVIPVGMMIDV
jgi:hypothetical protein